MPVGFMGDGPKRENLYGVARAKILRGACMGRIRILWKRLRWVVCGLLGLLIAFLLERQGWSVDQLFRERPAQAQVEAWFRGIQPTKKSFS